MLPLPPISIILVIWFSFELFKCPLVIDGHHQQTDDATELFFRQRSPEDWFNVWHQETHSRCRNSLIRHMHWVCEKDIYKVDRRDNFITSSRSSSSNGEAIKRNNNGFSWITAYKSKSILQTRRRYKRSDIGKKSITEECCTTIGCTWEEYAEYCPSNKRLNHNRH